MKFYLAIVKKISCIKYKLFHIKIKITSHESRAVTVRSYYLVNFNISCRDGKLFRIMSPDEYTACVILCWTEPYKIASLLIFQMPIVIIVFTITPKRNNKQMHHCHELELQVLFIIGTRAVR